jgi:hypothetical protein
MSVRDIDDMEDIIDPMLMQRLSGKRIAEELYRAGFRQAFDLKWSGVDELEAIRSRVASAPLYEGAELDLANLLAAVDAVLSLAEEDMVGWSYRDTVIAALKGDE